MRKTLAILTAILITILSAAVHIPAMAAEENWDGTVTIGGLDNDIWFTKYGNVYTDCSADNFVNHLGLTWGDTVSVSFLDNELIMPVVPTYSYVESGMPAIILRKDENGLPCEYVSLAINMGNFAEAYGIAEKVTDNDGNWHWIAIDGVVFPIEVNFTLAEKEGYMAEYLLYELVRTNNRQDYSNLTDEEYANFRNISHGKIEKNILYRTSSPINPEIGRNTYADAALKKAGVTVIMNLADSEDEAKSYESYDESYYSKQKIIFLNLGVDFFSDEFKQGLKRGLQFFAQNKGVYAIHCTEGKDRAGFVCALLECLMGAEYTDVIEDYMITYSNYYGIEKNSEKYNSIANNNIVKSLKIAFDVDDLSSVNLEIEAEEYIKSIGLSDSEIKQLKENLRKKDNNIIIIVIMIIVISALAALLIIRKKVSKHQ